VWLALFGVLIAWPQNPDEALEIVSWWHWRGSGAGAKIPPSRPPAAVVLWIALKLALGSC